MKDIEQELYNAGFTTEYVLGYLDAIKHERYRCANIAQNWGYTHVERKEQPWAHEANRALRTQNLEIAKRIRTGWSVRYSLDSAYAAGENRHPQTVMDELSTLLGFDVMKSTPHSIGDCWIFEVELTKPVKWPPFVVEI